MNMPSADSLLKLTDINAVGVLVQDVSEYIFFNHTAVVYVLDQLQRCK